MSFKVSWQSWVFPFISIEGRSLIVSNKTEIGQIGESVWGALDIWVEGRTRSKNRTKQSFLFFSLESIPIHYYKLSFVLNIIHIPISAQITIIYIILYINKFIFGLYLNTCNLSKLKRIERLFSPFFSLFSIFHLFTCWWLFGC